MGQAAVFLRVGISPEQIRTLDLTHFCTHIKRCRKCPGRDREDKIDKVRVNLDNPERKSRFCKADLSHTNGAIATRTILYEIYMNIRCTLELCGSVERRNRDVELGEEYHVQKDLVT